MEYITPEEREATRKRIEAEVKEIRDEMSSIDAMFMHLAVAAGLALALAVLIAVGMIAFFTH